MTDDLSLVPEKDLWTEITKRNDAVLMVTLKNMDGKVEASEVSFSGGKFCCLGLGHLALERIAESISKDNELLEEGDE